MSTKRSAPPFIAIVEALDQALIADLVRSAAARGFPELRATHNAVFATLEADGSRVSDMAARAGMTKQSMAAIVQDLVALGIVTVAPDPSDGRAKLVTYTERGWECVRSGEAHLRDVERRLSRLLGADRLADLRATLQEVTAAFG